ncbi:HU family DNA-binding protein [Carboxylicivirga linearis]|uniref:HU family DNA-binding protein n=1 Tax=Carboxylicivirga linearis TaxID=1628157 RepID=A0ABS5JZV4_9BACT|nr:HU family DNA-binding protein [Carboxylicivirga linearis]MBS2100452.1 HU family DNA-binding protein [Carboxylicivirga linearis]
MLKYKLIERGNPRDPAAAKKVYASPVLSGKKGLKAISVDIVEKSSLTRGDVNNTLDNLVDQIPKYLLDGNSVSLGDLGTLRMSFSSERVDSATDFNASMIKNIKIIFTLGKDLKKKLADASFEKASI